MNRKKTGNNKFLKQFNQTGILNLIRLHKAVSRADLAQLTGLTPTAVGVIVSNLLEMGYIEETGEGESKGGRKPVLLRLKPRSAYSVGIDLDVNSIVFVLMDTTGEVIAEKTVTSMKADSFEDTMKNTAEGIRKLLAENGIVDEKVLGIGVSVSAMVNNNSGEIILAPNLHWQNVNINSALTGLTGFQVSSDNESMASAIGESWLGSCQGVGDFVCINVKSGIGSGIYIDGRPYRGKSGIAGEIGHIVAVENGLKCGCGNYGCLETVAATDRMTEKAKKLFKQGLLYSFSEITDAEQITINMLVNAAGSGDETAKGILLEAAGYLGIAISNIVNTLNPEKIVLGKEFLKFSHLVLEHIRRIVEVKALKQASAAVQIMESGLGERASALGAAIIPLKSFFGV